MRCRHVWVVWGAGQACWLATTIDINVVAVTGVAIECAVVAVDCTAKSTTGASRVLRITKKHAFGYFAAAKSMRRAHDGFRGKKTSAT